MPILCITVRPVYEALLIILGLEGFLFSYADDVYIPMSLALALAANFDLYGMIYLQL